MDTLRVRVVQQAASLDPAENRAALDRLAEAGPDGTDLLVLPEAFARDFGPPDSDVAAFAEPLDGPFVERAGALAKARDCTVVAGMFEVGEDPARPYNTLVVLDPTGLRASYRKIHLYDSFGYRESDRLSPGPVEPLVVEIGGWQLGLMTCYDLRFPELGRALVDRGAEVFVVPAAWVAGEGKVAHWRTLLAARAVENTVYVAAAAQPGPRYSGHSLVVDPAGQVLAELDGEQSGAVAATLSREVLRRTRSTNPSLMNRRMR